MSDSTTVIPAESRTMPAVVYALYLIGLTHGLTVLIGLVIAYANRDAATPKMQSHYTFMIRTFWLSIGWFLIGAALMGVGIPFSLVLVGIPLVALGVTIFASIWIWFAVRCVVGVIHLARDEAYPRPYAWLI